MPQPAFTRSPRVLGEILKKMVKEGYNLKNLDKLDRRAIERLNVKGDTAAEEIKLLKKIDPSINGDARSLLEDLTLHHQETNAKKRFRSWEYVKSMPRRVLGTIKAHPKISIAIGIAALLAIAYFTGVGGMVVDRVRDYAMKKMGAAGIAQATEAAAKAGAGAAESATEAAKGAVEALNTTVPPPPVPSPLPTTVPSLDEAGKIIDALGRSG